MTLNALQESCLCRKVSKCPQIQVYKTSLSGDWRLQLLPKVLRKWLDRICQCNILVSVFNLLLWCTECGLLGQCLATTQQCFRWMHIVLTLFFSIMIAIFVKQEAELQMNQITHSQRSLFITHTK